MSTPDRVVSIAIPRPLNQFFTYLLPEEFEKNVEIGRWVKVPFGRTTTHGYIVEEPKDISELDPSFPFNRLKSILHVSTDDHRLSPEIFELCQFVSKYYHAPLGEALNAAASPAAMGFGVQKSAKPRSDVATWKPVVLSENQMKAFEKIENSSNGVSLLHGVTGSGKTEVYIHAGRKVLENQKSLIILVPEIALTHQLHKRFESGLGYEVGLWHSAISSAQRKRLWSDLNSGKLKCVIGARSAVFAPVQNLGMIIVDEEHDPTYKQEDRVRYHARDLAIYRAKKINAKVILGSATPALETLEKTKKNQFGYAQLDERYLGRAMPDIETIDLTEEELLEETQSLWSKKAIREINETIARGEQVIVFMNRRGFAHFLICEDCGEVIECKNCSISLTVHKRKNQLRCHLCDHRESIPHVCQKCQSINLKAMGSGTEGLERDLEALIPESIIQRLDRDQVTSATRLEKILNDFRSGKSQILVGTQMLAKGHDFPNVTLVVVAFADGLFRWPDFRANERAYHTLTQVAGRSGRGNKKGKVLIQTYQPEHLVIQVLKGNLSLEEFLSSERELREACMYPPFSRIARIRIENKDSKLAYQQLQFLSDCIQENDLEILGPSEAFIERVRGIYRWDLLLKAKEVGQVQRALSQIEKHARVRKFNAIIDVDPMTLS